MAQFNIPPPKQLKEGGNYPEILLTREILELGTLLSLKINDEKSFERYITQLKTFYSDYSKYLPDPPRRDPLLGCYLLYLLAENRIGEFHTELELIPDHDNRYIKYSIQLEQYKMEGRYNKVWSAGDSIPVDYYAQFTAKLMETARHDIGDSLEQAYESLSLKEAQELLMFHKDSENFRKFVEERQWRVVNGKDGERVDFVPVEEQRVELGAIQIITQSLRYAHELERII